MMSIDKTKQEIEELVEKWKDDLTNEEWINLLKKHGHYYHDIGINQDEVIQMWKDEHLE
jgi:hypothetical protein